MPFSEKEAQPGGSAKPHYLAGIRNALRALLVDTDRIFSGRCDVAEHVLRGFVDFEILDVRVSTARALLRTVSYILD